MRLGRRRTVIAAIAVSAVALAGCSSSSETSTGGSGGTASDGSVATCVDGDTVKLGFLNSTSGPMAISEQTVRDSLLMAKDEINADGGIMCKKIEVVEADGASDPPKFAEKIKKLLTQDAVKAAFVGWTSASRAAM